ncbi:MAG: bifunctional diaminohydroxyphosphoribosylaminopyrimidine deaminase/5-amino-6-(5-phosphoribosylamino)uracil reductase RibD [Gammaproteobacteria bacterium]|nr:bifunctional diaminohydroxyphosphoribosylaminopyrimidine deaminase/5-amino-6-(5-phosphoribosylamino)uracil reductase RibD [Gammaproteobacteria bacterium]
MSRNADRLFLRAAVALAERGLYTCAPNPRVGCLIVRDGRTLGRGWHVRTGEAHAEVRALADAGSDVSGATAYVSLEPCSFQGRTPPCTDALVEAGIRRVVAAMTDPHPRIAGAGFERLRAAGIAVELIDLPEARELNLGWTTRLATGRPWVRIKTAVSLDGRTAMASGESQWITGAAARADVQHWRARSCAVITGAGTVRLDNPRLTVRDGRFAADGRLRQPLRVVVSATGVLPPDATVLTDGGALLLACGRDGDPTSGPEVWRDGNPQVDLAKLLAYLGERQCNEVLVEAGPTLAGAFLETDLWDELIVYVAARLLGSDARPLARLGLARMAEAVTGRIADVTMLGEDVRLTIRRDAAS